MNLKNEYKKEYKYLLIDLSIISCLCVCTCVGLVILITSVIEDDGSY